VLKLSQDRIKGYRNFGTKIWNAFRFAEMNDVFKPTNLCTPGARPVHVSHSVNKWIIGETAKVRETVDDAFCSTVMMQAKKKRGPQWHGFWINA